MNQWNNGGNFANGYNGQGLNRGFNPNNQYAVQGGQNFAQGQLPPKRSGCKQGVDKNGKPYVSGWKRTRQGMMSIYARPSDKTRTHRAGAKGGTHEWQDWIYSIKLNDIPQSIAGKPIGICLKDLTTGKVTIKDMGYVLNPNAPRGGYCGRYGKK